ncbi:MAG: endonuclease III domain-containing protein [Phycisphaerae bacterium]
MGTQLLNYYQILRAHFGPQDWWPGDTPLEIIVGAVLTQNTAWGNVEKAIGNLKAGGLLPGDAPRREEPRASARSYAARGGSAEAQEDCLRRLHGLRPAGLAPLIRPAGYFNLKSHRLWNVLDYLVTRLGGRLEGAAEVATEVLRGELLAIKGVGPETADSILLYAFQRPVFVVDAYTHRVWKRHGLAALEADYGALQSLAEAHLPRERALFNDYHAQLVMVGKHFCKPTPGGEGCPLGGHLPRGGPVG